MVYLSLEFIRLFAAGEKLSRNVIYGMGVVTTEHAFCLTLGRISFNLICAIHIRTDPTHNQPDGNCVGCVRRQTKLDRWGLKKRETLHIFLPQVDGMLQVLFPPKSSCLLFNQLPLCKDLLLPSKIDISWRNIIERFMVSLRIVIADKISNRLFQMGW